MGARASGFRGECVIMEHCFLIRLPADGAEGRGAGPCPGRAAPSLSSSAQMPSCAERSLRKTGPEPDGGSLPGHVAERSFRRAERRAHLAVCRAGTQVLRVADTASSCAYACA